MKIGLEAISFDIPEHYIEMADLAKSRGVDPAKYNIGLGQKQMSVASPCEDPVVLATSAGERLLRDFSIAPDSIAMLITGTETGVDHSKPIASYVHEILGLSSDCRVFEIKHACYGAMAGLVTAINYILSGRAKGRKVMVIATDIARYGKNTVGEPTQGAGAVAMLVSDNPLLMEIDYLNEGFFGTQVMDFWRPLYSKEAFADGHYSIQCYLEALQSAYTMYKKSVVEKLNTNNSVETISKNFSQRFDACIYHVPFVKMAQKAHQRILETDAGYSFEKGSDEVKTSLHDFDNRVAAALDLNARIGNIYTGALFLGLYNLLKQSGKKLEGKLVSLFSYGSGCGAEFMGGKIAIGASEMMMKSSSMELLEKRKVLSVEQYEKMFDACAKMDINNEHGICEPDKWNLSRSLVYSGTQNHQRTYTTLGETLFNESDVHRVEVSS